MEIRHMKNSISRLIFLSKYTDAKRMRHRIMPMMSPVRRMMAWRSHELS